jgi:hypothetical protein
MEIKPTFFSITGFLIPGIVFVSAILGLVPQSRGLIIQGIAFASVASAEENKALFVALVGVGVGIALCHCLLIGSILSEGFLAVLRFGIRRPFLNESNRAYSRRMLGYRTLVELLTNELDAREAFAYLKSSGLDLHWFAGRIRMLGGSGLGLIVSVIVSKIYGATVAEYWIPCAVGFLSIVVAVYRTVRFDQYITVTAATARWIDAPEKS